MKLFDLAELPVSIPNVGIPLPKSIDLPVAGKVDLRAVDKVAEESLTRGSELVVNGLLAIVIFVVGWFLAIAIMNLVQRAMTRAKVDEIVVSFVGSVVRYAIVLGSLIVVLAQFGISGASIVAVFGAIGLAIALGLKDTLGDAAAGMMLLLTRPFTVKDYIKVGDYAGSVRRINLFHTELNTYDNRRVFMPNHEIWSSSMQNFSYNRTRMVEVNVGATYNAKPERVINVMKATVAADTRILTDPAPLVGVDSLDDSSVNYLVRVWVKTADWSDVRYTILQNLWNDLTREGIEIPFPQRVVHMVQAPTPAPTAKKPARKRKA